MSTTTAQTAQRFFAHIRKTIEPIAVRLGDRRLKVACCDLVLDDGSGRHARRALGNLRGVSYRLPALEDATRRLAHHLAGAGAR